MRDRVTISIDSNLKRAYEDIFGKEYAELLDEAIRKKLLGSGRIEAYEAVIKIVDAEQEERRQRLASIRLDLEHVKSQSANKSDEEKLAELREEKFQKDKKSFLNMLKNKSKPNWKYIMIEYYFNREIDAERWWWPRVRKELENMR